MPRLPPYDLRWLSTAHLRARTVPATGRTPVILHLHDEPATVVSGSLKWPDWLPLPLVMPDMTKLKLPTGTGPQVVTVQLPAEGSPGCRTFFTLPAARTRCLPHEARPPDANR